MMMGEGKRGRADGMVECYVKDYSGMVAVECKNVVIGCDVKEWVIVREWNGMEWNG